MNDDVRYGTFVWNGAKEKANIREHGLSFEDAAEAFADPRRVIAKDDAHSKEEERLFCIGSVNGRVATVRFTLRGRVIRIFGAGFGGKGGEFMKKQISADEPIGKLHVISDFLPPPEELFPKREGVKVTLIVDRESVNFFRQKAHRTGMKYQRMMREVLREYSNFYRHGPSRRSNGRTHTGRR